MSMESLLSSSSVFPNIMGTEEEIRVSVHPGHRTGARAYGPGQVMQHMQNTCKLLPGTNTEFFENGARFYLDGGEIELASADTDSPANNLICIKADAEILLCGLSDYVKSRSKQFDILTRLELHRRVIDSQNGTWGCHDNFSVQAPDYLGRVVDITSPLGKLWNGYFRSRNFITGAGYVGDYGLQYSQKLSVPNKFCNYSVSPSLFRMDGLEGQRFETRCNDVNLKDCAVLFRIGGTALWLAASQTGLASELVRMRALNQDYRDDFTNDLEFRDMVNMELTRSKDIQRSIDLQVEGMTLILEKIEEYANEPIPPHLRKIGEEIINFATDFEAVVGGKADVATLADRADWAEKVVFIRRDIMRKVPEQDRSFEDVYSIRAEAIDQLYDLIKIEAQPDGTVKRTDGYGYIQAAKQSKLDDTKVTAAMKRPPKGSRAARRVEAALLHGQHITSVDWSNVKYTDKKGVRHRINL